MADKATDGYKMRTETCIKKRLEENSIPDPNTGCVLWTLAARSERIRYGSIWYKGRTQYAHRVSYLINVGEIPEGLSLLHSCDTPECINPNHLTPGTHLENMLDASAKGRLNVPKKRRK